LLSKKNITYIITPPPLLLPPSPHPWFSYADAMLLDTKGYAVEKRIATGVQIGAIEHASHLGKNMT